MNMMMKATRQVFLQKKVLNSLTGCNDIDDDSSRERRQDDSVVADQKTKSLKTFKFYAIKAILCLHAV